MKAAVMSDYVFQNCGRPLKHIVVPIAENFKALLGKWQRFCLLPLLDDGEIRLAPTPSPGALTHATFSHKARG
jgi:hypothetical protein